MTQSLGLIGVGAFGALAAKHLAPHFDLVLHDAAIDIEAVARNLGARSGDLRAAAGCDIVIIAVPVQKLTEVLIDVAPLLKTGALVLDVASVKIKPVAAMLEILPPDVAIVGTHPMFGPQSGKTGIAGLNIVLCDVRGGRCEEVARFCAEKLGLSPHRVTAEEHDREAAYVQGLTHFLAKIVITLDPPSMRFPTRTYELMQQMVEMIRHDSDDLFRAIIRENPFAETAKQDFFAAARAVENQMTDDR
jgi:prephenate dehydrogenase